MRVLHLCHLPLSPDHPDAGRLHFHPGRWVLNLALAQKAHSTVHPELVVQIPGASRDHSTTVEGIPVHYIRLPDRLRAATLFEFDRRRLAAAVRERQPDLVHAHGTEEGYGLAAQTTGRPYVISAQGVFAVINRIMPPPLISRARVIEWTERRCLRRARDVIAKSDYIAAGLRRHFPHLRLHRIPNTYDPALTGLLRPQEPRSIAFVGMALSHRKGLHLLLRALLDPRLAGCTLHIVGNRGGGGDEAERALIASVRDALGSRATFHGMLPARDTAAVIAGCELLAAPSLEEMFGNQVVEALLVGTWPVVSSGTAMEENVRRLGAGTVFTNGSSDSLAENLCGAFAARAAWNPAATRTEVEHQLGPATVAAAHASLYQDISARS